MVSSFQSTNVGEILKEKKIFIIRHAKAEEHSFLKNDCHRNITEKGANRSLQLISMIEGKFLNDEPILFLSSSANRAIQTAEICAKALDYPIHAIQQTKNIYEASYKTILKEINKTPDHINTLFVFGHNPGLSDLVNYICDTYVSLSTSAIAEIIIESDLNFKELSASTATLKQVYSE